MQLSAQRCESDTGAVAVLRALLFQLPCISSLASIVIPWYSLVLRSHAWCHTMYKGSQHRALVSHTVAPYLVLIVSLKCPALVPHRLSGYLRMRTGSWDPV